MKKLFLALIVACALVGTVGSQTILRNTTTAAAVTSSSTTVRITSATGVAANSTGLYIDHEYMPVTSVSGTTISVQRGRNGTQAMSHKSGAVVIVTQPGALIGFTPVGSCSATTGDPMGLGTLQPVIEPVSGNVCLCRSSEWKCTNVEVITGNSFTGTP